MKLRLQLGLISLTFLGLPWAGCALLSENEQALRQAQIDGLQLTASAMAIALSNQPEMLYIDADRATAPFDADSLYSYRFDAQPIIDGYLDEWVDIPAQQFNNGKQQLRVKVAANDQSLLLALQVFGSTPNWYNPGLGGMSNGDRLLLSTWIGGKRQEYVVTTSAPGAVRAQPMGRRLAGSSAADIKGWWVDTGNGHQLELHLPRRLATSRFGIQFITVNEGGATYIGNMSPLTTEAPPWLVIAPLPIVHFIEEFNHSDLSITVLDRWGWPLATSESQHTPSDESVFWLMRWFYRQILAEPEALQLPASAPNGQWARPEINQAILGLSSTQLYENHQQFMLSVAAPIVSRNGVMGVVNLTQPRDSYLSLSDSAFASWLVRTLAALVVAGAGLFGFALFTSWRIRQLSLIVKRSNQRGTLGTPMPSTGLADEIDDLAQDFNRLLSDVQGYQQYLSTLTHTLAHDLRTPIAVIASSLDNLKASDIDAAQKEILRLRALSGLERLASMLSAMNEANRIETAIAGETLSHIDLLQLLRELTEAYQGTFKAWNISLDADVDNAWVQANAELIVQALDKLIDNAASFAEAGSAITVSLDRRGLWWRISVSNSGPALPEGDSQQLFDPLVSHRKNKAQGKTHMGLGLHIVKLIARRHNGEPVAFNRADSGVCVGFTVRA